MEIKYRVGDEYGHGANPFKDEPEEKVLSVNLTATLIVQDGDDGFIHQQIKDAIMDATTQCNAFTKFDYEYDII